MLADAERPGLHSHAERGNDHVYPGWRRLVLSAAKPNTSGVALVLREKAADRRERDPPGSVLVDAERPGRHSHAGRGNDKRRVLSRTAAAFPSPSGEGAEGG